MAGAVLALLLLSASLTGLGPLGGALCPLATPVADVGEVKDSPPESGQFTLVLSADRTSINQYEVMLNNGPCATGPGYVSIHGGDTGRYGQDSSRFPSSSLVVPQRPTIR